MTAFDVQWRKALRCHEKLTIAEKHVLGALAEYADYQTHGNAHPGVERLMADTLCSKSVVKRALARGEELGFIEQTLRGAGRLRRSSEYRLLPQGSAAGPLEVEARVQNGSAKGPVLDSQGSATGPPSLHYLSNTSPTDQRSAGGPLNLGGDEGSKGLISSGSSSPKAVVASGSSSPGPLPSKAVVNDGTNVRSPLDLPACDACRQRQAPCPFHKRQGWR